MVKIKKMTGVKTLRQRFYCSTYSSPVFYYGLERKNTGFVVQTCRDSLTEYLRIIKLCISPYYQHKSSTSTRYPLYISYRPSKYDSPRGGVKHFKLEIEHIRNMVAMLQFFENELGIKSETIVEIDDNDSQHFIVNPSPVWTNYPYLFNLLTLLIRVGLHFPRKLVDPMEYLLVPEVFTEYCKIPNNDTPTGDEAYMRALLGKSFFETLFRVGIDRLKLTTWEDKRGVTFAYGGYGIVRDTLEMMKLKIGE